MHLASLISQPSSHRFAPWQVTEGKITYGPQANRPASEIKNATDANQRYEALVEYLTSVDEARMTLSDLQTVRDFKMVRNRVRQGWLTVNSNKDATVREVTFEAYQVCDEGDWKEAMVVLDKGLYGVGPATGEIMLEWSDS